MLRRNISGAFGRLIRVLFLLFIARPVMRIVLGLNIRGGEFLPEKGPAVLVANHNSHLGTLALISALPVRLMNRVRPIANASHFESNRLRAWFAKHIIGVIAVCPGTGVPRELLLAEAFDALDEGDIVIIFPEGTNGLPEKMTEPRSSVATLAFERPQVPLYPIYLNGFGRTLPKGTSMLVPFVCDMHVGSPMYARYDERTFTKHLLLCMTLLGRQEHLSGY